MYSRFARALAVARRFPPKVETWRFGEVKTMIPTHYRPY
jgi:hypothetical protein